ncbi:5'-nucleotidase C-terminal domain-containing protein [Ihuprevotella massiliensis]|uniref:5'-nucleotidase C-terminal domain-containing protein n=1 Tax=Ihuprevotella massiliensis TaxID=1852368 RepID=UPI00094EBD50
MLAQTVTKNVEFSIVETSDVHGNYFPYDFINAKPGEGSLSRISTFVKQLRQKKGNHRVLLVDNGDILQGQPSAYYYNYVDTTGSHLCARMLNDMGYLCATLGNHDVETGHAVYDKWMDECGFAVLGANVYKRSEQRPYLTSYIQEEVDGVRIAVLGLITPTIPQWLPEYLWANLDFKDATETAKRIVPIMRRAAKADVVVVLIHSGVGPEHSQSRMLDHCAYQIAEQVPDVDVVFCGHDHRVANREILNDSTQQKVLVLNPGANAMRVAQADFTLGLDAKGKVVKKQIKGKVVDIKEQTPDQEFLNKFQKDFEAVKQYTSQVIGYNKTNLDTRESFFGPSPFVDYIHSIQLAATGADISFAAPLSFDAAIPAGPIKMADLFNLYKYENQLLVLQLSGQEIKRYLEESYSLWTNQMQSPADHILLFRPDFEKALEPWQRLQHSSYNFDSAAGLNYTVDVRKPKGEKVTILGMADGTAFDLQKQYRVAVNSYRANGGGGLLTKGAGIPLEKLKSRVLWTSDCEMREYLRRDIARQSEINPHSINNWKFIPEDWVQQAATRDANILFQ